MGSRRRPVLGRQTTVQIVQQPIGRHVTLYVERGGLQRLLLEPLHHGSRESGRRLELVQMPEPAPGLKGALVMGAPDFDLFSSVVSSPTPALPAEEQDRRHLGQFRGKRTNELDLLEREFESLPGARREADDVDRHVLLHVGRDAAEERHQLALLVDPDALEQPVHMIPAT